MTCGEEARDDDLAHGAKADEADVHGVSGAFVRSKAAPNPITA
jgi:hypothetical protein